MPCCKKELRIMNKRNKEALNMFFSAFLVVAYVICCYFIMQLADGVSSVAIQTGVSITLVVFFGVMLFYATRVGDGKQVIRFSPSVLILLVLPSVYTICAYFAVGLPLHNQVNDNSIILYLASVTLGYSVPYSFTSGFELVDAQDVFDPDSPKEKDTKKGASAPKNNKNTKKKK